jgi:hypothetical protein
MGVTLELTLLVVAGLVVLGGLGVALALRRNPRPRRRAASRRPAAAPAARPRAAAPAARARSAPPATVKATTLASATRVPEPTPEQAHQAKLEALQAMLALGDRDQAAAKARAGSFPDTEPTDAGYAATEFVDRADPPKAQASLLNLDREQRKRPRS